ncbi:MAG: hypothetical protein F4Y57_14660 [Acidobacteria bacterium]|nr:hypothetical protein [Acidobacteriota bacterium]
MCSRLLIGMLAVLAMVALAPSPAAGQSGAPEAGWTAPRTPDGRPDLQGIWTNNSATPMQRPEILGDKATLTAEELAQLQQTITEFRDAEQAGDLLGDRLFQQALGNSTYQDFDVITGNYNAFWLVERELDARTSLIVDPPNGRFPPLTPAAQARAAERRAYTAAHPSDGPEDRTLGDRCLHFGAPRMGAGYNSYFQILQTPDHVAILQEMGHEARLIPLDGRPHVNAGIRLWNGNARARWEGESLVIETSNFSPQARYQQSSENLRMVERFTRIAPDTIRHEITLDDPTTWTRPWAVIIILNQTQDPLFEFACHEGYYPIPRIQGGARAEEAESTASE